MVERVYLVVAITLAILVCVEVAIISPVIVTQKQSDESKQNAALTDLTNPFGNRMERTVKSFMYRVARTANSAPQASEVDGFSSFWSQERMASSLVVDEDPVGVDVTYVWVPLIRRERLKNYSDFYGYKISHFDVKKRAIVPYDLNTSVASFAPYTLFVPDARKIIPANVYGFDILSLPSLAIQLKNASRYLIAPATLLKPEVKNKAIQAMAMNDEGSGWVAGAIGTLSLLQYSLPVSQSDVRMVAYTLTNQSSQNGDTMLYIDGAKELENATTLERFLALPISSNFYLTNFTLFNVTFVIGVQYSAQLQSQYDVQTWIILTVILAPVCFLLNIIICALILLWDRRSRQLRAEAQKREYAQVMLGYVNHEIRNPLQTILGIAEISLEDDDDNHLYKNGETDRMISIRAEDLRLIVQSAESIERIARDVLDVRRAEEGKTLLHISDVNIADLKASLEASLQHFIAEKPNVKFVCRIDSDLISIWTDRYRLEQILINFLSNAFKHTESGAVVLAFSCVSTNVDKIRISVADTGKGIDETTQKLLFAQFSQSDARDGVELGGFGLGLFLSKMLATLLGAQIGFSSRIGVGSTFWIELPMRIFEKRLSKQFDETKVDVALK